VKRNSEARSEVWSGMARNYGKQARHWIIMATDWTGHGAHWRDLWEDRQRHAIDAATHAAHAVHCAEAEAEA